MKDNIDVRIRNAITDIVARIIDYIDLTLRILQVIHVPGMEIIQHRDIMFAYQSRYQIRPNEPCSTRHKYVHGSFLFVLIYKCTLAIEAPTRFRMPELATPVLVGGLLLGDRLLYFCYGAGFARGAPALYLLLAAQVVNVFMYLQTMGLLALDRPKESFKVATVAAIANILLDLALIPMLGITGAAVATLLTMTLNAVLAYHVLKRIIDVRLEYPPVRNILVASALMGLFVGAYRLVVPLSSIWLTLVPVAVGAAIYGVVLLRLDRGIHDELRAMAAQMGVRLPRWL